MVGAVVIRVLMKKILSRNACKKFETMNDSATHTGRATPGRDRGMVGADLENPLRLVGDDHPRASGVDCSARADMGW